MDITDWLNKNHREWYDLYSDTGEVRCHSFKPPVDATHYRHVQPQFGQAGTYYKIEEMDRGKSYSHLFLSYMVPGYSDWRVAHLSTMQEDIAEVRENCFQIARIEGPFEYNRARRNEMDQKYPVKIKVTAAFLTNLLGCESGRHQDAVCARESDDKEDIKANGYDCVFCDFGDRWKTQIECRNDAELKELYYVCASGTIGVVGYTRTANKVLDQIREQVRSIDSGLVQRWKRQDGF